ncbi:hypothetical protein TBLA_0A10320 [Henningerozyma blattae CBS 6284]|uniref:AMP-dependent synthetase/ligase domain-containing protein n=1 Tax=Henningerozyma blattae (strain ATCC 34711 / CBS 6284 / DSM 70876 / NBRC 10599 / NRRL Y-10934 / UCD 77-7) TaxID=1071380 RepID=I2GXF8_HENB6|nr:hypothetical protein TBLA_0A10320 [Tetrapisispora blattae CBS 6284]CCH58810.1 hypothetical protein TBLA_0A10320 [Tetrapisispora blattae CBS 6284]
MIITFFKYLISIFIGFRVFKWLLMTFYFPMIRDLDPIALNEQSNKTTVRQPKETAIYRNFLIPNGLPLTTGLGLSAGYKLRNGNFGDVWNSIICNGSSIKDLKFINQTEPISIFQINSMAKLLSENWFNNKNTSKYVGIAVPLSTSYGFISSIACMMSTIYDSNTLPLFLHHVPRTKIENLDILILDTWESYKLLGESKNWYKMIIVCESTNSANTISNYSSTPKLISFFDIIKHVKNLKDKCFEYQFNLEKVKDDQKQLFQILSPTNKLTQFTQVAFMSGIASFIKTFPVGHSLTDKDVMTLLINKKDTGFLLNTLDKIFAVLLHGGSIQFINELPSSIAPLSSRSNLNTHIHTASTTSISTVVSSSSNSASAPPNSNFNSKASINLEFLKGTTLLSISASNMKKIIDHIQKSHTNIFDNFRLNWATLLFSYGIFSKCGERQSRFTDNLRCIYLEEIIKPHQFILNYPREIPKLNIQNSKIIESPNLSTVHLNLIRSLFGTRLVRELIIPYLTIGPIAQTNFYDYRVLSSNVDDKLISFGPLSTSLEGKFVSLDLVPELDIRKRQGMLCIRGFNIGLPVENDRLEKLMKVSEDYGGKEGWMPLVGLYGLWGLDGCLFLFA